MKFGSIDGEDHKAWCLDQLLGLFTQDKYHEVVKNFCNELDGSNQRKWNKGVFPSHVEDKKISIKITLMDS